MHVEAMCPQLVSCDTWLTVAIHGFIYESISDDKMTAQIFQLDQIYIIFMPLFSEGLRCCSLCSMCKKASC